MTEDRVHHPEDHLWVAAGDGFEQLFRSAPGHEVVRVAGGLLALTGVSAPDLNCGVVWAAAGAGAIAGGFAGDLRGRGLPGIVLVAEPACHDARRSLEDAGLVAAARMPLMARGPGPFEADPRFLVRRATSVSDLGAANRLIAAAFDLPADLVAAAFGPPLLTSEQVAVELILAGDEPVGSLQTTAHDRLVGIWSMATPPAHRRRGVARAGLSRVLANRFAAGAAGAFLIATAAGQPLYEAAGFRVVAWSTAWLVPLSDRQSRRPWNPSASPPVGPVGNDRG